MSDMRGGPPDEVIDEFLDELDTDSEARMKALAKLHGFTLPDKWREMLDEGDDDASDR